jgi:hypothetical protein
VKVAGKIADEVTVLLAAVVVRVANDDDDAKTALADEGDVLGIQTFFPVVGVAVAVRVGITAVLIATGDGEVSHANRAVVTVMVNIETGVLRVEKDGVTLAACSQRLEAKFKPPIVLR